MMRISSRSHMRPNCVVDAFLAVALFPWAPAYRRSSNPCTTPGEFHASQSTIAVPPPLPRSSLVHPAGSSYLPWRHPPCSSGNRAALVLQTMHGNFHPTAPGHQSAPAALSASGAFSVSACGSTIPPLASSVAMSLLPLPAHPHPLSAPPPASVQIAPAPCPTTSSGSAAEPSAGTLPASPGSNLSPHCGAADPSLLPRDTASTASSSAGNSTPVRSEEHTSELQSLTN